MGDRPPFFLKKAALEKNRQLFGFLDWRMPLTHGACVDRVQKTNFSNQNVIFIYSYTLHRVKSLLYTKSHVDPEQQQRNVGFFLEFNPRNRDSSH
jgi:hypothetical protein